MAVKELNPDNTGVQNKQGLHFHETSDLRGREICLYIHIYINTDDKCYEKEHDSKERTQSTYCIILYVKF